MIVCAVVWSVAAGGQSAVATQPITVRPVEMQTEAGPIRGFLAEVDLATPGLEVVGTVSEPDPDWPTDVHLEATLVPVPTWAESVGAALAINANYYAKPKGLAAADIIGLSIHDGHVLSPPRVTDERADPALIIGRDGIARIGFFGPEDIGEAAVAVAGVGPGDLLVTDGRNTGETSRVQPMVRHPRTAIGVDATGRRLIIAVIDGRQPEWSVGMTLPDLADVMIGAGAHAAINLDGGGSSTFYWIPAVGETPVTNRPSDGHFRAVANALGFVLADRDAGMTGETAPADAHEGDPHAH